MRKKLGKQNGDLTMEFLTVGLFFGRMDGLS
jgi:hypothetical protein